MSTGNLGIALMLIADRLGDPIKAETAVQHIEAALMVMRDGGNPREAAS
jgi:hypothetical protein